MEILELIRGLRGRECGSCEILCFGARLSLRRKSRKASLVSLGSASGVRRREGGLLIQEGGDTGHWEVKGGTLQRMRHASLTRNGGCWEGKLICLK